MSWTCPTCARTFAREEQFHSHGTEDVDVHFAGRPERLRESFDKTRSDERDMLALTAIRTAPITDPSLPAGVSEEPSGTARSECHRTPGRRRSIE